MGRLEAFLARQVPTRGRRRAVAKTDSCSWWPVLIFNHNLFEYNGEFLRVTNQEQRLYLGLRCGFAATDSRLYYDHVPPVINSGYVQNSRRDALWTSPTESHTGDENKRWSQIVKKYTANGLVRRGRPKPFWPVRCRPSGGAGRLPKRTAVAGRPVARCDYSLFWYNDRFLRATRHQSRATIFSRAEGHSRRCRHSEFVAA